jgi:CBS domain-containing protein
MEKNIVVVGLDDTVDQVNQILDLHKLSCVPVIDSKGECFGVICATDLVPFHKARRKSKAERAWEVFTHKVIEVSPTLSIKEATELMTENHIHHLVVTENKSIKGIVSSIDLLKS